MVEQFLRRIARRGPELLRRMIALDRRIKRAFVLAVDLVICAMAVWIAFSLRFGVWSFATRPVLTYMAVSLLLVPPTFTLMGVYRTIFRFAGSGTVLQLAKAVAVLAVPLLLIFTLQSVPGVPRTLPVIHPLLFFGLLALARILGRYLLVDLVISSTRMDELKRIMIYGAGRAGRQLFASLRGDPKFELIGFLDDDERLDGQRLDSASIYHSSRLPDLVERYDVDTVFIALPNASRRERNAIITSLRNLRVHVQILPSISELADGQVSVSDLREIRVEDLLGREPVAPNQLLLGRTVVGKTVLVTGAGGSIGSELARQIARLRPARLVLADMSEPALFHIDRELTSVGIPVTAELVNMANRAAVERLFERWRPDTVFHAAAYKHVPLVEANIVSGLYNNIIGTRNAAQSARRTAVKNFILISTDKAVRPTNVMGASKRVCELLLQSAAESAGETRYAMVRFGNVLGSSGSVVPHFERQIREGGPVTVTHRDITRFFMTIPEAAQLVIQAGALSQGGEVFLLDMGKPVRIFDLARTMIELAGLQIRDADNPEGDIAIEEIGLRPGEKLYEELLIDDRAEPTHHPMIMKAREGHLAASTLDPLVADMESALLLGDAATALDILRVLVPEYQAENSLAEAGLQA